MYAHRQRSRAILLVMLLASVVPLVILLSAQGRGMPLGARITMAASILAIGLSALAFSSLTIEVGDGMLAWSFGPGILRKSVALSSIANVAATTTTFLEGWGIHFTGRGWLYNVSGRDAVLVTLRDGKQFLLGTDEPAALLQAIRAGQGATLPT